MERRRCRDSSEEEEKRKDKRKNKHLKKVRKDSKRSKRDPSVQQTRRRYSSDSALSSDSDDSYYSSSEHWSSSPKPKRRKKHKNSKESILKNRPKHKKEKSKKKEKLKKKKKKKRDSENPEGLTSSVSVGPKATERIPTVEAQKKVQTSEEPVEDIKAVLAAQSAKKKGPMTKEEYEKQQSVVRRVYDPDTGRHRLVKGDGEIIEEIVSKDRHRAINKQATLGDGSSFQAKTRNLI